MITTNQFLPLSAAEVALLNASGAGEWANICDTRPSSKTNKNHVRAAFVRFLALGGDCESPVHHRGIQLSGAYITGNIDLTNATLTCSLVLKNCWLEEAPVFVHTKMTGLLSLRGSRVPGIDAQGLRAQSSVVLDQGFESMGTVLLKKAFIAGDLDLDGGNVYKTINKYAINAEDAHIQRNCKLGGTFRAFGEVRFIGAKIGGDFDCRDGEFNSENCDEDNCSLVCDGIEVSGSIFLTGNFQAIGIVSFPAARVEKGLYILSEAPINSLDVSNLSAGFLVDEQNSWGQNLRLNGFVYKSIRNSNTTCVSRLNWLKKQRENDYGKKISKHEFTPQPWLQCIHVLRSTGHDREANRITIAYQKHLFKIGKIHGFIRRIFHFSYGKLTGFGYRPHRIVVALLLTWVGFAVLYWDAALNGVFTPTNPLIFEKISYEKCRPVDDKGQFSSALALLNDGTKNWYTCDELKGEYTTFSPLAYSLDIVLPLIDLQQEKDWAPFINTPKPAMLPELVRWSRNHVVRIAIWIEIILGWVFSLLLVAQLSSLIRANKD